MYVLSPYILCTQKRGRPDGKDNSGCDNTMNYTTYVTKLPKQHPVYMVQLNLSQLSLSKLHYHSNGCKSQHYINTLYIYNNGRRNDSQVTIIIDQK